MPEEQWLNIGRVIDRLGHTTEHQLSEHCREKDCKNLRWMGEGMNGFERAEMLNTRGFKEGKRSWIDVMPKGGPRMRVTHEILEGLEALTKEEKNARRRAKRAAGGRRPSAKTRQKVVHRSTRSDKELEEAYARVIKASKSKRALRAYLKDHRFGMNISPLADFGETKPPRSDEELERIYRAVKKAAKSPRELVAYLESKQIDPALFRSQFFDGLEGIGSSLALMWAAAGAAALLVLSNAQKAGALSRPSDNAPDPAAMIIRADLNRARAAQGLPPLPG